VTQTRPTKPSQNGAVRKADLTGQLGVPLGRKWSTFDEDFLTQLRGRQAIKHYREMSDNDATVGSILFGVEMLIRQVEWPVIPGGDSLADEEAAAFLESCKEDMSLSWNDFIAAVMTFLPYGWSFHEIVYKLRTEEHSLFNDGKVGWGKFAYQPQEALHSWSMDEHGGLEAFNWMAGGSKGSIPIEKGLLFRTTTARGPNGRSILRNAFRPYQFKKRVEEILMIGIDRDLNGLPIARIPADSILDDDDFNQEARKVVTRIKRDEQWGVVFPLEYDENGNPMYEFDVLRSDGASSIAATKDVVGELAQQIANVVLAGFVHLGQTAVGSRALAEPQQQLFQKALQGWVDGVAETLNRFAVPRLFALNGFNLDKLPQFKPEEIADTALDELGTFVRSTAQAGMDWGFLNDEDQISDEMRQAAGFDAAPRNADSPLGKGVEFDPTRQIFKTKD
jgi:hypothetical protein